MPIGGEGEGLSCSGLEKREILVKSGRARVLIGGCSEWRCLEMVVWSSGQPTMDISVTGGVLSSSGYSSIFFFFCFGKIGKCLNCDAAIVLMLLH